MTKTTNISNKISMRGYVMFPRYEDGKFTMALAFDESRDYIAKVDKICESLNSKLDSVSYTEVEFEDKTYPAYNMKSSFDFPIYEKDGTVNTDYDQYYAGYGAEVIVQVLIKEYEYKRKRGHTMYITGMVILEHGQDQTASFDSIMEGIEDDDIQF